MSYAATESHTAADRPLGTLETVATFDGPMPTGVTVSHSGRIFVNFPKWGDEVTATVVEVREASACRSPTRRLSPADRRAAVDGATAGRATEADRPGSDGIAISSDGERLYYCPFASRWLWSVSVEALVDRSLEDGAVAASVVDEGDKGSASDGLETDDAGRLYATAYEHNAILRRLPDGEWETVVHDPRLLFPDTLSVATDRYLYVTSNQLHRQAAYQRGKDLREWPYHVFRTPIDAGPVLLRP